MAAAYCVVAATGTPVNMELSAPDTCDDRRTEREPNRTGFDSYFERTIARARAVLVFLADVTARRLRPVVMRAATAVLPLHSFRNAPRPLHAIRIFPQPDLFPPVFPPPSLLTQYSCSIRVTYTLFFFFFVFFFFPNFTTVPKWLLIPIEYRCFC